MLSRRTLLLSLSALSVAACGAAPHDWAGVRLGMSVTDVRDRFQPGGPGAWTSAQEPEPVLRWVATDAGAPIRRAQFEVHKGMLVALTLGGSAFQTGPRLELTRASVAARREAADGPEVRVISRECETHRAEVGRVLSGN